MKYDTVVFDMDGTLLNTLEDLRDARNHILKKYGSEEKSPEEAALALGRPVKTIHTQLSRGKRLLRERLERSETHGPFST